MNPDLLPDEFWDWLQNGSPANNEVLAECYKQFLSETDKRELIPVATPFPTPFGWVFVPVPHGKEQNRPDSEIVDDLEVELIARLKKRFKEEL